MSLRLPEGGARLAGRLVVVSRRSALARAQARRVGEMIGFQWPDVRVEFLHLTTEGDRVHNQPLPALGGKGLFTADLEEALLTGAADLAVHSLKDLPTRGTASLKLLAVPEREDCRDVLLSSGHGGLEELPKGARVGTSSLRRQALLLRERPDCAPHDIRGNVETRLRKWEAGEVDALILAAAGLARLGFLEELLGSRRATFLDPLEWLPAPGQGALGVQGRVADERVSHVAGGIDDPDARITAEAERAVLDVLGAGCQTPVGAYARRTGEEVRLRAIVLSPDGSDSEMGEAVGLVEDPEGLGRKLAGDLEARGVRRLLALSPS